MRKTMFMRLAGIALAAVGVAGCTVHPPGESRQRRLALAAGKPYLQPIQNHPVLPAHPTRDDLVRYALLNNASVEQKYWQWRSALEQVPIEGTQPANLALFGSLTITDGYNSLGQTTASAGNGPMNSILLPPKLDVAARRALETAKAAGLRFRQAQFDLRAKVLSADDDLALQGELIRLEEQNHQLLQLILMQTQARTRAGQAGQQDLLKAENEVDLSANAIANMQSKIPALKAAVNALLNRRADAALPIPAQLPPFAPLEMNDRRIVTLAADRNPQLKALADEIRANHKGIELAKLQYLPNVALTMGTNLTGVMQSLSGMITVPFIRYEAIQAAIAQAQANLRANEAARRQVADDLAARLVQDLATLHDADRQLTLFDATILPRARQQVRLARAAYEAGNASLLDLLDSQRMVIGLQRLAADLQVARDQRRLDIESIDAAD
jgi:outer membrane protein, heavy metal efflux system